jgi:ribosomal protein L25 (general stress protein Ctc)
MVEGGGSGNGRRTRMRGKVIKFMSEDENKVRNLKIKRGKVIKFMSEDENKVRNLKIKRGKVIKFMSEDENKATNLKVKKENERKAQADALIVKKSHMGCQTSC